jgi:hypothetical protein
MVISFTKVNVAVAGQLTESVSGIPVVVQTFQNGVPMAVASVQVTPAPGHAWSTSHVTIERSNTAVEGSWQALEAPEILTSSNPMSALITIDSEYLRAAITGSAESSTSYVNIHFYMRPAT